MAEPILVECFTGLLVPEPTTIGSELVAQHACALPILPRVVERQLVLDEIDAGVGEKRSEHFVDAVGKCLHLRDLTNRRPSQHSGVVVVAQGVVQGVALQKDLEDRLAQLRTFGNAIARGHRPRADIAHDAFDGNHTFYGVRHDGRIAIVIARLAHSGKPGRYRCRATCQVLDVQVPNRPQHRCRDDVSTDVCHTCIHR